MHDGILKNVHHHCSVETVSTGTREYLGTLLKGEWEGGSTVRLHVVFSPKKATFQARFQHT